MTRTVRDAALMFGAMARHDWRDPFCPARRAARLAGRHRGRGRRYARRRAAQPRLRRPVDADGIAAVEQAAQILSDAGAELEEADPGLPDTGQMFTTLWSTALRMVVANTRPTSTPCSTRHCWRWPTRRSPAAPS